MPRRKSPVKGKPHLLRSQGLVDLHFHGAFGIDLMRANGEELEALSRRLWEKGVAGFCPTTLSAAREPLVQAVQRLGHWIRSRKPQGARPLGIHLEGPFISPNAAGAHPQGVIRPPSLGEWSELWDASEKTLKIITLAPETSSRESLLELCSWASERKIVLSLGHSRATQEQAAFAFQSGVKGVTHAWNALPFHHRETGPLGAAIGNPAVYLELIVDGIHVAPEVLEWTLKAHDPKQVCFVSDAAPAANFEGKCAFGPLEVHFADGACRLPDGKLAGGGSVLSEAFCRWLEQESSRQGSPVDRLLLRFLQNVTRSPLKVLGFRPSDLGRRSVRWRIEKRGKILVFPVDSA